MSTKRKVPTTLAKPFVKQSAKPPVRTKIDETRTAVTTGRSSQLKSASIPEAIEISSDSSSDYDIEDDRHDEDARQDGDMAEQIIASEEGQASGRETPPPEVTRLIPGPKLGEGIDTETFASKEGGNHDADVSDAESTSPTFGELIRGGSTVDVSASLALQEVMPLSPLSAPQPKAFAPVSHSSLGTVLNQALRTDDRDLLESCLQTNDYDVVMNTINRLDSSLAGKLLSKLASRMHRRPGRALSLMKWMQGTLIAHGGALAMQPDLLNRLSDLNRVLEERSRGLSSLLALKGKLDMLDAQLKLRKSNRGTANRRTMLLKGGDEDEETDEADDEEGVVYVEGREEETQDQVNGLALPEADLEDEDDFPIVNGFGEDSEEDEDENDDQQSEEAFEVAGSLDEDEVNHDDVEESGEEDDSEEEVARPPSKVQKVASGFTKRK